ncbi:MAG: T9SS type A sorting domain-containing protein, partial [Bacteroidales bacterium]|nr:T9SS type A sorting domain-containing protein [Bacteroidales bacterium]
WATDSAGIDSTTHLLFETVVWPENHAATIWIDEIRLGDSAAAYVPSSEAEILATMYGTVVDANKLVDGVVDTLSVTEFLIGLTISDLASVLMLDGPGGDTITKPERTDIADTQVIQVTAEDGTIQEYTITVWPVSVGNLIAPDVVIYPNPARDILYIQNIDGFDRLSVTNIVGKHVRMINIETKQLDINVSNLENGLYFLNLYSSKYGTVTTKFIKR